MEYDSSESEKQLQVNPSLRYPSTSLREAKYRRVIIRIALYPIVSLILNSMTVGLDIRISIVGIDSHLGFQLLVLDLSLFGICALVYSVLALGDA
ncbi:hypothetical protein H0H87_005784, partial [Tephrocybe sp. NHM501043]